MNDNVKAFILTIIFLVALTECKDFLHYWGSPDNYKRIGSFIGSVAMVSMFLVFFKKYMRN